MTGPAITVLNNKGNTTRCGRLTTTVKWGPLERMFVQCGGFAVIGTLDDPCALDLGTNGVIFMLLYVLKEIPQSRLPGFLVKAGGV